MTWYVVPSYRWCHAFILTHDHRGFYYWYGLYRGWLEWVPDDEGEDGTLPRKRQTSTA